MNKKNHIFEKIGNFVTGKGFYLVVLICVAAIALSGFYLVRSVKNGLPSLDESPVSGSTVLPSVSPSPSVPVSPALTAPPSVSPSSVPTPSASASVSPAPSKTPAPSPAASSQPPSSSPAAQVFTWPVKGPILSDHSVEALVYDVTMGDWRTHPGIDIAAPIGTQVLASTGGKVTAVYEDDLLGTTVIIDHGNGLTGVYANLSSVPTVKTGDKVTTGTVIGTVGKTAFAESLLDPHLHFAMYLKEQPIDPQEYLPEQ